MATTIHFTGVLLSSWESRNPQNKEDVRGSIQLTKPRESIHELRSNDSAIGYNQWPKFKR